MTATADIIVKQVQDALLVPSTALRFTPPIQDDKKPSGGLLGSLLPRPPKSDNAKKVQTDKGGKKEMRLWTLSEGKLSPIPVTVGETDGHLTELIRGAIKEGTPIVVDIVQAAN
jgi:HlyD family secretion protein